MTDKELLEKAKKIHLKICERRNLQNPSQWVQKIEVAYALKQNNFTIVVLNNKHIGVAKRKPTDTENENIGVARALHRAVEELLAAAQ